MWANSFSLLVGASWLKQIIDNPICHQCRQWKQNPTWGMSYSFLQDKHWLLIPSQGCNLFGQFKFCMDGRPFSTHQSGIFCPLGELPSDPLKVTPVFFSKRWSYKSIHDMKYLYAESLTMIIWFNFSAAHRCEQEKDICKNGGACQPDGESYTCNCTEFWRGDHCEDGESTLFL